MPSDEERKRAIEAFLDQQRAHRVWCEYLKATITLEECQERHSQDLDEKVWGGRMSDALATLQDKHCKHKCTDWKKHRDMLRALKVKRRR